MSISRGLIAFAVALVAGGLLVGWPQTTKAHQVPETLRDRAPVGSAPVEPGFSIEYVGVLWEEPDGHDRAHDQAHDDPTREDHGAIRFRDADGQWGSWRPLIEDGADEPGQWGSGLVAADDAEAYQIRGVPDEAVEPRAVAMNTTDGPPRETRERPAGASALNEDCVSRAEWGADEDLRSDDDAFVFFDAQVTTVHHTATDNNDDDPASTVRAIYEYHTVDRGWDDIGYNYLIDEDGRLYEGRWSGADSESCASGGDGTDFAHHPDDGTEEAGYPVRGAHSGGYNTGNIGVALLGEFTTHPRWGGQPTESAVDALEGVLAHLMERHGLDPQGTVDYSNDVNQVEDADTISGHRDWTSTECPGQNLYDQLPDIRAAVAERMDAPSVTITEPDDGATFEPGTDVVFSGSAQSADGTNMTESIEWTFDGTFAGSGETVTVEVGDGEQDMVAAVEDGGVTAEDVITVVGESQDGGGDDGTVQSTVDSVVQEGTGGRTQKRHLDVTVTLTTTEGDPVEGATVDLEVDRGGNLYATATDTTGSDGVVSFRFKNIPDGCYTSTVTAVSSDPEWDGEPASSTELCKGQ